MEAINQSFDLKPARLILSAEERKREHEAEGLVPWLVRPKLLPVKQERASLKKGRSNEQDSDGFNGSSRFDVTILVGKGSADFSAAIKALPVVSCQSVIACHCRLLPSGWSIG